MGNFGDQVWGIWLIVDRSDGCPSRVGLRDRPSTHLQEGPHAPRRRINTKRTTVERKHGGHIVDAKGPTGTPFDYLLPQLKDKPGSHLPGDPGEVVADLNALGAAMVDEAPGLPTDPQVEVNSTIPALYTYWGQFIDHDLTANTDRDSRTSDITKADLKPVPPREVTDNLRNLRRPALDLDSVYGGGPSFGEDRDDDAHDDGLYDGLRFRVGRNHEEGIRGVKIPPVDDLERDLPRIGKLLDDGVITQDDLPEDLRNDPGDYPMPVEDSGTL